MVRAWRQHNFILASASPRRLQLLRQIGIEPIVQAPDIEEKHYLDKTTPAELATHNAIIKAQAVVNFYQGADYVVIGADTIVFKDGQVFNKPEDAVDAALMLQKLSAAWHSVFTAICLVDCRNGRQLSGYRETKVRFAALNDVEISSYVQSGEPLDKAGAYGIQGQGALLVEEISGDYGTVVGLSLPLLHQLMQALL